MDASKLRKSVAFVLVLAALITALALEAPSSVVEHLAVAVERGLVILLEASE